MLKLSRNNREPIEPPRLLTPRLGLFIPRHTMMLQSLATQVVRETAKKRNRTRGLPSACLLRGWQIVLVSNSEREFIP
jgi:hypothetical protein